MNRRITNPGLLPHDQIKFDNPALDTVSWGEKREVTNLAERLRGRQSRQSLRLQGVSLESFYALVGEVILVRPALATIGRALTELANTICAKIIEAQPARERLAIRLRDSVGA